MSHAARLVWCLSASIATAACTLLDGRQPAVPDPAPARNRPPVLRISQFGFGPDARFARCPDAACPSVTSKVLAAASVPDLTPTPQAASLVASPATFVERTAPVAHKGSRPASEAANRIEHPAQRTLTLHFSTDAAQLTSAHKAQLSDELSRLRASEFIVISGRTDDVGSESANQALALTRGLAVRDHLLDLDPSMPARIVIDARGRCCYASANESRAGRARNRRVEVAYRQSDREAP